MSRFNRVILVVLDGVGIGEMPDAADWGDAGSDTLGHVLAGEEPRVPCLEALGLGNIRPLPNCPASPQPQGAFGKAAILSKGKDTTVGHWEMAGLITPAPFPTYPEGFPDRVLRPFKEAIGRDVLGNKPASGTEIINELGEQHIRTGKPIVYTSADSVFQIAAHEHVISLDELYRICRIARELLDGRDQVARVIARPFLGSPGSFTRTGNRRDFAIPPPAKTLLEDLQERGLTTLGVGKVPSLFDFKGISDSLEAHNNREVLEQTLRALERVQRGLVFSNFVDFDMLWGHRNDPKGFAVGLEEFDRGLMRLRAAMTTGDCLIITADHGCDPITPSTDHSREYVPVLACGPALAGGADLGVRSTLADLGQTIAENFGFTLQVGTSFLQELR